MAGLGGYSWQHFDAGFDLSVQDQGGPLLDESDSYDWNSSGFVVGFGMETALTERLHLLLEYKYSQYQEEDFGSDGFFTVTPSFHTAVLGLNYRLGESRSYQSFGTAKAYDWTGLYVTGAAGAGALVHDVGLGADFLPLFAADVGFNGIGAEGIFGEVGVGGDIEFGGGLVIGAQASARWSGVETSLDIASFIVDANGSVELAEAYDVVARAGIKMTPNTLIYALGGWTQQKFAVNASAPGFDFEYDFTSNGFTVGGGIEAALSDRLVAGVEYRYAQYEQSFSDEIGVDGLTLGIDPSSHSGRVTLKYKLF